MANEQKSVVVGLIGISALLQLALGIVAIIYGADNLKEMCSDSFLHLSIWLIVQGAVMLFVVVGGLPLKCFLGDCGTRLYFLIAGLYSLFELIWVIIGGVILWRDSTACQDLDPTFYTASMVVVIASMVLLCCGCMRTVHEKNESEV